MRHLGMLLAAREAEHSDTFPDLRQDQELVIVGYYSGDHKASDYRVLTFLLADRSGVMSTWEADRLEIRRSFFPDKRTFAFKKLSDAILQKALVPFLKASSRINGIIFCVAIDKSLDSSSFGYQFGHDETAVSALVLAKATKIAVLGSILVGGLAKAGQNLTWITDNDEIVINEKSQSATQDRISAMVNRCCPYGIGSVRLGIAGLFDDEKRAEDLCAIPDLVGGAIAESLTSIEKGAIPRYILTNTSASENVSTKTKIIYAWLSTLNGPLKKLFCLLRAEPDGKLLISFADPTMRLANLAVPGTAPPLDKGWTDSSKSW